jgi:hypothetical protein
MDKMAVPRRIFGIPPVLLLIFFFLPWITISCGGERIGTVSGFQLATGNLGQDINQNYQSTTGSGYQGDWRLIAIAVGAIAALVLVFLIGGQFQKAFYGIAGAITLGLQLWHYLDISGQITKAGGQSGVGLEIIFEIGWWLTGLMSIIIVCLGFFIKSPEESP